MKPFKLAITLTAIVHLLGAGSLPMARAADEGAGTVDQLFARSARAYQAAEALKITMTTSVEIPEAKPGERVNHYLLGKGREAVVEIGSLMRVVVTIDRIFAERAGLRDRVLELKLEQGDLAAALAAVRGRSALAGFWEPPQAALRSGKTLAEVLNAFRYSPYLGELSVAGFERAADGVYEVRLEAHNGSCVARFDPASFYLVDVAYIVVPSAAPEGYALRARGRFTTQAIAYERAQFDFDAAGRLVVDSLRGLAAAAPGISRPPETILSAEALAKRLLGFEELVDALRDKRVLLIGEDHLYAEPPAYTARLLEALDDKPVSLHLELPRQVQPAIDAYLRSGDETFLDEIFTGKPVLQLQHLLRWVHQHRARVAQVEAFDEPIYEIFLKRAYTTDTRNVTMSQALHRAWRAHPERRIVAYAGQLHMMKAGRYLVDQPSRDTAGSRLPGLGISRDEIACLMLNGDDNFHLHSVWDKPGVLAMGGNGVQIPIAYFIDFPIYGVAFADEAFDYFVNLGAMTKIEVQL